MADRQAPQHALDLSTQDFLSLLNTPPGEVVQSPTTPTQEYISTPRSSSAGHTPHRPRASSHFHKTSPPTQMPSSHSVTFQRDPVSHTRVFNHSSRLQSGETEPTTPKSSPFNPEAFYRSPEDERTKWSPSSPSLAAPCSSILNVRSEMAESPACESYSDRRESSTPLRTSTTLWVPGAPVLHRSSPPASPKQLQTLQEAGTCPPPPLLSSKTKKPLFSPREKSPERSNSLNSSGCQQANANIQPLIDTVAPSPTSKQPEQPEKLHIEVKNMSSPTRATAPPAASSRRKSGLFNRVKHATTKKIHGTSGTSMALQSSGNIKTRLSDQNVPNDVDLDALFCLVEGRITFDREIKSLFEESDGLKRVWKEAIPLFQKGDKDGFAVRVERLEAAMTALSGRSVVFVD